ncbi:MAG TPA: PH domain-containing protein [Edaphocola sp.]|nr:PH domain-containing protein [Edaphocola sp.]
MNRVFKSKVGMGVLAPPIIILSVVSYLLLNGNHYSWVVIIVPLIIFFFIFHMIFTTNYTIDGNDLIVRCGFFYNKIFKISEIRKIVATKQAINAPATSIDRLRIEFSNHKRVIVSPREKKEFIEILCKNNHEIVVKMKNRKEEDPDFF